MLIENRSKRIARLLVIDIFSMLIPMILVTSILDSSIYLAILYALGFFVQFVTVLWWISTEERRISYTKNNIILLSLYFIVLFLPIAYDIVKGISINYFDPINSIIKLVYFVLFYVIFQKVEVNRRVLTNFCKAIIVFSAFLCMFSFIFEFEEILSIPNTRNSNVLKISSIFSNRNQYASFLVIAFVANLYYYQIQKKPLCIIVFVMQSIGILTTFSRAAFFSIFIIIGLMFVQKANLKKKVFITFVLLIGIIIVGITTDIFSYIAKNYIRLDTSGDSGRFELWKYAWDIAKENFFLGIGFYTGADLAMERGMEIYQFHNMFFDLLVGGGILELAFVLVTLYSVYRMCVRKCPDKNLVYIYRASFASFIFHACFESLSIFALSYADVLYTVFYISIPILLSNMTENSRE